MASDQVPPEWDTENSSGDYNNNHNIVRIKRVQLER